LLPDVPSDEVAGAYLHDPPILRTVEHARHMQVVIARVGRADWVDTPGTLGGGVTQTLEAEHVDGALIT